MSFRLLRRQGGFGPAPGRGEPLRDVPKDLCRPKTPQPCEPRNAAESAKQEKLGALQQAAESGYEVNLQPMKPEEIAKAAAGGTLAVSARLNAQAPIDAIKGGPHAHGTPQARPQLAGGTAP